MNGLAVYGFNVAISSLHGVHLCYFVCSFALKFLFELCLYTNIMGQDKIAPLWSFGSSMIRVPSVSFHMIKSEVHLDILYAADVNSRQHFRAKYQQDQA